jgi:hypothetical protein
VTLSRAPRPRVSAFRVLDSWSLRRDNSEAFLITTSIPPAASIGYRCSRDMPSTKASPSCHVRIGESGGPAFRSDQSLGDLRLDLPNLNAVEAQLSMKRAGGPSTHRKSGVLARTSMLVQTSTRYSSLGLSSRVLIGRANRVSQTSRTEGRGSVWVRRAASQRLATQHQRPCRQRKGKTTLTMSNGEVRDLAPWPATIERVNVVI